MSFCNPFKFKRDIDCLPYFLGVQLVGTTAHTSIMKDVRFITMYVVCIEEKKRAQILGKRKYRWVKQIRKWDNNGYGGALRLR